jgi:hypothetical protein
MGECLYLKLTIKYTNTNFKESQIICTQKLSILRKPMTYKPTFVCKNQLQYVTKYK